MTHLIERFWKRLRPRETPPQGSLAHTLAHRYWQRCSNTFITNPEYYEKCEAALRDQILPRLGNPGRVLDLGCGNGRFTFLLASAAKAVDACDLSPTLIAEARTNARDAKSANVRFRVEDITALRPRRPGYDVVSCMGVLSTIVDEWAFQKVTLTLRQAAQPGGLVLLRDSVSLLPEGQLVQSENYATRYRNEDDYRRRFADLGMSLEHEVLLAEFGTCVNRFYLYRVTDEQLPAPRPATQVHGPTAD